MAEGKPACGTARKQLARRIGDAAPELSALDSLINDLKSAAEVPAIIKTEKVLVLRRSILATCWPENALVDQFRAEGGKVRVIDRQYLNRGSRASRSPFEKRSVPLKMAVPLLPPGMKQRGHLAGHGIDSGDIRPLVFVAVQAAP